MTTFLAPPDPQALASAPDPDFEGLAWEEITRILDMEDEVRYEMYLESIAEDRAEGYGMEPPASWEP